MITINNWQNGQSSSPFINNGAFAASRNVDINSQKGLLRSSIIPRLAGTPSVLMNSYAITSTNFIYMAGNEYIYGVGWDITVPTITSYKGTGATKCEALGVAVWEGYLLGVENDKVRYSALPCIGVWGDFDAGDPSTLNDSADHCVFNSVWDGSLYIGNGQYVAELSLDTGATFDPTDDATYTFVGDAFKLPTGYIVMGISEIDNMLVISAKIGSTTSSSKYKTTFFFWNRADTTSEYIYEIDEPEIHNLHKRGRNVYASGGIYGSVYKVGLYGVAKWKQIPFDYDYWHPPYTVGGSNGSGKMADWCGNLVMGVGHYSYTGAFNPCGIYTLENGISHLFNPSSGDFGYNANLEIGTIASIGNCLIFSWSKSDGTPTIYGIDVVKNSYYRPVSYTSWVESLMYPVGSYNEKKSFDHVEVQLAQPLATGQGVIVKYRTEIEQTGSNWTTLGTQTYATNGAVHSLYFPGIHNVENIQIRIELTSAASSSRSPCVKEVHLI